ncbi:hypothetical protein PMIN03_006598 [Paraphaeosphaeria minitans]
MTTLRNGSRDSYFRYRKKRSRPARLLSYSTKQHSVRFEFIVSAPAPYFKMHSSAFIFSILPAAIAVLPTNVTYPYPRRVLHTGSFTRPNPSVWVEPGSLYEYNSLVITGSKAVCTLPVVTVTTTVTSATLCGKDQPSQTNFPFTDCRYDLLKLSTCTFPNRPIEWTNVPTTQDLKTAPVPTKVSKTSTVTWWDAITTITGGGPWSVVPTLTNKVITAVNGTSRILATQHTTTTVRAKTYNISTATVYPNTTSISGIFINPASLTQTHHAVKTKTSTFVDFQTKTKVHAHTTVPIPYEAADDSSDDDAYPSETRLPKHPIVPVPISIVDGSRTLHVVSKTKSTTKYPAATEYPQDDTSDSDEPQEDKDEDETYEPNRRKSSFYDNDDGNDENEEDFDDDVTDNDEETALRDSYGTKLKFTTATSIGPPKVYSTKTTGQWKHASSSTRKPAAKPKPTASHSTVELQSTTKKYTALTLFASVTPALPTKRPSKTKSISPAGKTTTSPERSVFSTSHTELQIEDFLTKIPIPSLPYNKTYKAHFPLSSVALSYKPAHHGHLSTASPSQTAETDDPYKSPSSTVTWHPVVVSTAKPSLHLSNDQSECIVYCGLIVSR